MIRRKLISRIKALFATFAAGAILILISSTGAYAQEAFGVSSVLLEKITVTARKREEPIQNVPLSVTHFSSEQIDTLKVRNLESLTVTMPNVALDDIGTVGGIANFSIRGSGINSSIPSVDPTVGMFVDGVYFGANIGALFDTFDIESIEVLRGPQGTLFGRNVIGGAILVNTKKPGDSLEMSVRTSFEGGGESLNSYYMGTVGGPLSETVSARITAYTNQDNGWFKNLHTGEAFGDLDIRMVRPVLVWEPMDDLSLVLRYQYERVDGDGPAAQSHTNGFGVTNPLVPFDRDSHDFSIDEKGKRENDAHFFTAQMDWEVDFGGGTITNIFSWRDSETSSLVDLDASPLNLLHAEAWSNYSQLSNELRYSGRFLEKLHATTGVYYFTNEINYHERRSLLTGAISLLGGGNYDIETLGLFLSLDYDLTSQLTLTAGTRYTREKREAEIARIDAIQPCNIVEGPACEFDFTGEETWHSWSPKLGAAYYISPGANVYGHWTRGFRSGGYNLRNLIPIEIQPPGPYNEEKIDSFEAGFKISKDRGRLYGAVFYNMIDDMQREINFSDETLPGGIVQLIDNTADVEIYGFELDGLFAITESLFLVGSAG
ncbi:MAG: TonB-dependent receptor [Candidatus Dadabacteria bacterium]|nr:TonB-dependent receptor [Candidatus Dadabacteria bacterium]